MRESRRNRVRSRGFSLIEFITSGALTLLLLAGVGAIFIGSRTSYGKAEQLGQIQENGRYALDQISHHLRMAGFTGCSSRTPVTAVAPSYGLSALQTPLRAFNADSQSEWQPNLPEEFANLARPGTDALIITTTSAPLSIRSSLSPDGDTIQFAPGTLTQLKEGAIMLASNCEARATFEITSISDDVVKLDARSTTDSEAKSSTLGFAFPTGTEVMQLQRHAYFLRLDPATARSALWRQIEDNEPEQLASGIEDLQFKFGVDSDGDGVVDDDSTADLIQDWTKVLTVSIKLVVAATDSSKAQARNGAPDLRETFTAAITLRNRTSTR